MKLFRCLSAVVLSLLAPLLYAAPGTIESTIQPPPQFARVQVKPGSFAAELRQISLIAPEKITARAGNAVCMADVVAVTAITPFDNQKDEGLDGILKLWGDYAWKHHPQNSIAFPLNNGQVATWKDWRDGLRPKKTGGRYIFTQVTTPSGGPALYQEYLSFVAEEMGAIALRVESSSVLFDDSISVGDLIVALRDEKESHVGIILDACKGPSGQKLFLIGTSGTPSTNLYVMRPFAPVQGEKEWFTLEGARWAIGQGARTDLRRVSLTK